MKKHVLILVCFVGSLGSGAQQINIGSGAKMVIGAGATVSVGTAASSGTVTNTDNAGLVIQSTSSGTGSLICGGTPNATVQRYLSDSAWHLVTPTTTDCFAVNFFWNHSPECWLASHDESTNLFSYNTNLSTSMPVGKGWSVWVESNATATMSGTLQSSGMSPAVSYTAEGFNLVGNPFPCAIDFLAGTWTMTYLEETIWVWNSATSEYLLKTSGGGGTMANGIIPVGQGFFVNAQADSPVLTIPAAARTHNTQAYYKNSASENGYDSYITFNVKKEQRKDEVWISFGANGTNGFDNGWDATKLFGNQDAPQLYLLEQGRKQSIDHLFTLGAEERIVSMGFIPGVEGEQTMTANLEHYIPTGVTLEDLKTGQVQNLIQNPVYNFTGTKQDNPDRFRVNFKPAVGIEPVVATENYFMIYGFDQYIYIRSIGEAIGQTGVVKIFDLCGRLLAEQKIDKSELIRIPVDRQNAYLIIQVVKPCAAKTQKIFIR